MLFIKNNKIEISNKVSPSLIAEIGINHGGSLQLAKKMAKLAVKNGANIIKHQTHFIDDEMSQEADNFKVSYVNKSIYNIMKECALSKENEVELKRYIEKDLNSIFISTPFSRMAANFLNKINVPFFKIGSGECNNYPLIEHIAKFKKPIILSTGMNDLKSIKTSVKIIKKYKTPLILMHTTNSYPCPDKDVRLNCINIIKDYFKNKIMIGYSDHSEGELAIQAAVMNGAVILEKHFTDTLKRKGPDIKCSMDPKMCKNIANNIKRLYIMNKGKKKLIKAEKEVAKFAFASVCSIKEIKKGEYLSKKNIWVKRPGTGDYSAKFFNSLVGKQVTKNIKKNTQIKKFHFK
tara:strand:+ start:82 stop:1125 length:1044 start_codon:yes stop_codon:yes gene_type:complete